MNTLTALIVLCLDFVVERFIVLLAFVLSLAYQILSFYSIFVFGVGFYLFAQFVSPLVTQLIFHIAHLVPPLVATRIFEPLANLTEPCWLSMIYQDFIGFCNILTGVLRKPILACFEIFQSCKIVSRRTKLSALKKMRAAPTRALSMLDILPRKAIYSICFFYFLLCHESMKELQINTLALAIKVLLFLIVWNVVTSIRYTHWKSRPHLVAFIACHVIFVFVYVYFTFILPTRVSMRKFFVGEHEALFLTAGGPSLLLSLVLFPSIANNCFSLDMSLFLLGCLSPCVFMIIHVFEPDCDFWKPFWLGLVEYPAVGSVYWKYHLGRERLLLFLSRFWNSLCFVLFFSFSFRVVTWKAPDSKPTSYAWIFEPLPATSSKITSCEDPANQVDKSGWGLAVSLRGLFLFQLLLLIAFAEKHAFARAFIVLEVLVWLVFVQWNNLHSFRAVSERRT